MQYRELEFKLVILSCTPCLCGSVCFVCVVSELDRIDSYSSRHEFPVCVVCLQRKDTNVDVMLPGRQVYPLYYEMA
jgi:hypothetical protein